MHDLDMEDNLSGAPISSTFPQKLFAMSLVEFDEGEVIHWLPHGLAFKVVDSDRFSEEVVPKYFKHTKLTSFQRQLNLYGFRRITKGDDHGSYFHPNFQRGRKDLVSSIRRLPAKVNRFAIDVFSNETEDKSMSSKFGSFADFDVLDDECDQPPKKKISSHPKDDEEVITPISSFFDDKSMIKPEQMRPSPFNHTHNHKASHARHHNTKIPVVGHQGFHEGPHQGYPTRAPLPAMSKLTMNIGYARHLAATPSSSSTPSQDHHQTGAQAILEPYQYSSYNLLSRKRPEGEGLMKDGFQSSQPSDPFSYQQAYNEVREAQQNTISDYPPQSSQLNSMYANNSNSSSANDFKSLMSFTSNFSNWNDGSIWNQSRIVSKDSSSASSICGEEKFLNTEEYNEIFEDFPSFDDTMDMMATR